MISFHRALISNKGFIEGRVVLSNFMRKCLFSCNAFERYDQLSLQAQKLKDQLACTDHLLQLSDLESKDIVRLFENLNVSGNLENIKKKSITGNDLLNLNSKADLVEILGFEIPRIKYTTFGKYLTKFKAEGVPFEWLYDIPTDASLKNELSSIDVLNQKHLVEVTSTDTASNPISQSDSRKDYSKMRELHCSFPCSSMKVLSNNQLVLVSKDHTLKFLNIDLGVYENMWPEFSSINNMNVLSDGRLVSTKFWESPIYIYDPVKQTVVKSTQKERIYRLIVLSDDTIVTEVSRGNECFVCIWNAKTWKVVSEFNKLTNRFHIMKPLRNGGFVSYDYSERLAIWDVKKGQIKCSEHQSYCNYNKTALCELHDGTIAYGDNHGKIRFWDPKVGYCEKVLNGHQLSIHSLHTLSDGRLVSTSEDAIRVWDMHTYTYDEKLSLGLTNICTSIVMPDDRIVAVARDRKLRIWG